MKNMNKIYFLNKILINIYLFLRYHKSSRARKQTKKSHVFHYYVYTGQKISHLPLNNLHSLNEMLLVVVAVHLLFCFHEKVYFHFGPFDMH